MKTTSKNLNLLIMAIFVIVFFSIVLVNSTLAIETGLDKTASTAGFKTESAETPPQIIASVIQIILGFVGTLFLILIIVSGFQWMTAGGNSDAITKSRGRMLNATIGLVIILAAYAITTFVIDKIISL